MRPLALALACIAIASPARAGFLILDGVAANAGGGYRFDYDWAGAVASNTQPGAFSLGEIDLIPGVLPGSLTVYDTVHFAVSLTPDRGASTLQYRPVVDYAGGREHLFSFLDIYPGTASLAESFLLAQVPGVQMTTETGPSGAGPASAPAPPSLAMAALGMAVMAGARSRRLRRRPLLGRNRPASAP